MQIHNMPSRILLDHLGQDRVETYSKIINGICKCGRPHEKVIDSSLSAWKDGVRYHDIEKDDAWSIFRCGDCKEVISESFIEL